METSAQAQAKAAAAAAVNGTRSVAGRSRERLNDAAPSDTQHPALSRGAPASRQPRAPALREPRKRKIWVVRVVRPAPEEGDITAVDAKLAAAAARVTDLNEVVAEKQVLQFAP